MVLSVGFGKQRIAVDTHVFRVANRVGLTAEKRRSENGAFLDGERSPECRMVQDAPVAQYFTDGSACDAKETEVRSMSDQCIL